MELNKVMGFFLNRNQNVKRLKLREIVIELLRNTNEIDAGRSSSHRPPNECD